jgi:Fe2+-dicitrate sensor, membrane component
MPSPPPPSSDTDWERLARYLAGESDHAERARVERELAEHPDRAMLLDALNATTRGVAHAELAAADVDRALAAVVARRGATVAPLAARLRWRMLATRAAAAVLVIAGGAYLLRTTATRDEPAVASTSRVYTTGVGALDSLRLPDGTRVVLGPRSTVRIDASSYGAPMRVLALRGQALFEVVHDPAHPFVVQTATTELRDVGTRFGVESIEGSATLVTVTEGAVTIAARPGAVATDTLRAGEHATISNAGVSRGTASSDDLAWLERHLVFRGAPLTQVAGELRRWYGLELVVRDSSLAARHLTVTLDPAMRSDVGRLLGAVLGASVAQHGDTVSLEPTTAPIPR